MPNSRDIPLEHGCYYHIFNRGINGTPLFYAPENYLHFLRLYDKYITPIADTFAWCLMGNHFHLLVRIKEENEVIVTSLPNPVKVLNPDWVNSNKTIKPPHLYFSHLFNSYAQAINKQQHRTGTLFERPFHRLKITSEEYFQNLVVYIHQNPVHHGFTSDFKDYPWSSYGSIISTKPTKVDRETVLERFGGKENFIDVHRKIVDLDIILDL
jgi:REP element-mobilizing transposase RayT